MNFKHVHSRVSKRRRSDASNREKEGQRERDGRERWVGRNSFTSVHVRNLWHQCSDATAAKNPQQFLLNMHVRSLHVQPTTGQYCLIRGVKLAGWVLLLPHPVQDRKDERCFPMQPLPTALAESASLSSQNRSLS